MERFPISMLAAAVGLVLGAVPVTSNADDFKCVNTSISNMDIAGNLVIPSGNFCNVNSDVTVSGNVIVEPRGVLAVSPTDSPVKIGGNFLANQCSDLGISAAPLAPITISGNVVIENCKSIAGVGVSGVPGMPQSLKIGGNFTCIGNAMFCVATWASVTGNTVINDNGPSRSFVTNNNIGGNLVCIGNASVTSSGNTVGGRRQGQC